MESSSVLNRSKAAVQLRDTQFNILQKWETLARQEILSTKALDRPTLRNNLPDFLLELADSLALKRDVQPQAPKHHAEQRANLLDYTLEEVVREYRLLRRVIFDVMETEAPLDRETHEIIEDRLVLGIEEAASLYARLTQKALREKEAVQRRIEASHATILYSALDAIIQMDQDGKILSWNPSAEHLFGHSHTVALGMNLVDLIIPFALRERHRRGLSKYLVAGEDPIIGQRLEHSAVRADGRELLVELTITHTDADGSSLFTGYFRDLTDRRRLEEERNSILLHARCILWSSDVSRWDDEHGPHLDWQWIQFDEESAQTVLPLSLLPGENYATAIHRCRPSEDNQRMSEVSQRAFFSGDASYNQDFRCTDRHGRAHWLHEDVSIQPLAKERWRAVGMLTDITERKEAEERLQSTQSFHQSTLDALTAHIAILDETGRILSVNQTWRRFARENDYRDETHAVGADYVASCLKAIRDGTDLTVEAARGIQGVLDGKTKFFQWEYPCHSPTEQRWFLLKVTRFSTDPVRIVLSHENITLIKQAEQEIVFQARLLDVVNEAVIATDLTGKILYWNRFATRLFGWEREEIIGQNIFEITPRSSLEAFAEEILQKLIQGESWSGEFLMKTRNGREVPVFTHESPLYDEAGQLVGGVGISSDITERMSIEQALRESEDLFRSLVEQSPLAIQILSPDGFTLQVNQAWRTLWGIVDPLPAYNILEDSQLIEAGIMEDLRRGFAGETVIFPPVHYDPKKNSIVESENPHPERWTQSLMYPVVDLSGEVKKVVLIHEDITERKKLEEQLRQSQKMEAIGRLAGGIAHDFNNMLTVINGYSDLLLQGLNPDHPMARSISQINAAGKRAAGLTRQLLAFSRQQILDPRILDLNHIVGELEPILRRLIGEDVELTTVFCEHPVYVKADPTQLEQIVMNLTINARDAMPLGGRIEIRTGDVHLTLQYPLVQPVLKEGRYRFLTVQDTGTGMSAEMQEKIFEPFFTTKEVGKGTGLGLSTVFGIVQQSEGYILVESELGEGATFKIYLPWVEESVEEPQVRALVTPKGSGTLLVAEDDPLVQEVVKETLEGEGYVVLVASNGEEALQICAANPGKIDLLLTDTVMPKMGGAQLIEAMRSAHPHIPLLLMSGYADEAIRRSGILSYDIAFISKPFSPKDLFVKVNECLNQAIQE
jgi:PAS domain S-box-containing protein